MNTPKDSTAELTPGSLRPAGSDVAPVTPEKEVKESTAEGALAAFKVIVENFTPPGYTRDSTAHPNDQAQAQPSTATPERKGDNE